MRILGVPTPSTVIHSDAQCFADFTAFMKTEETPVSFNAVRSAVSSLAGADDGVIHQCAVDAGYTVLR